MLINISWFYSNTTQSSSAEQWNFQCRPECGLHSLGTYIICHSYWSVQIWLYHENYVYQQQFTILLVDDVQAVAAMISRMKLKKKDVLSTLIRRGTPQTVGAAYGSITMAVHDRQLYVVALDSYFSVSSLAHGFIAMVQLFYILDIHYPKPAGSMLRFIAHLCGIHHISCSLLALLQCSVICISRWISAQSHLS